MGKNYTGQNVNVFRNGILQKSGSFNEIAGITDPAYPPHVNSWNISGPIGRADFTIINKNKIWSNKVFQKEI